jgi:hypothetical protein
MKRSAVVLFAFAVMVSYNVMAQGRKNLDSESKATYSSERLNLWSADVELNLFGNSFDNFRIDKFKVRRYLNDNAALRLSLGFDFDSYKSTSTSDNEDPNINKSGNYSISHSKSENTYREKYFKIGVGYEYHKDIFDRVDIYAGGEIGYYGYFYSATEKTTSDSESQTGGVRSESSSSSTTNYFNWNGPSYDDVNDHNFYISGLAGVDVYFYKNMYIGAELGVAYRLSTWKDGYYEKETESVSKNSSGTTRTTTEFSSKTGEGKNVTTTPSGTTTTTNTYTPVKGRNNIDHDFYLYIEPAFHIGIRF